MSCFGEWGGGAQGAGLAPVLANGVCACLSPPPSASSRALRAWGGRCPNDLPGVLGPGRCPVRGSQIWATAGTARGGGAGPQAGALWEHVRLGWDRVGREPHLQRLPLPHPCPPQALLLLGAAALACLALDLLFLLLYSFWLCCRRRKSEEHLDADCCCTAWCVVIATLVCR